LGALNGPHFCTSGKRK